MSVTITPRVIASHNGLAGAERTYAELLAGARPVEACVRGVTLIEDDPREHSVGIGGIPNEEGVVQLDAAVMDGTLHRGAGVAALEGIRNPAQVALKLLEQTHRVLLVGEGAQKFALANGFPTENLLTDKARRIWMHWKRTRSNIDDWKHPEQVDDDVAEWFRTQYTGASGYGKVGTVHVAAIDANGQMGCCTSTSGHSFKLAGRVGDSPILGAGLFADSEAGTCGSIGHGEANLENCSSFACVEMMRGGMSPEAAGMKMLERIARITRPEQKDDQGRPKFNLWLFLLAPDGRYAGVTMWGPKTYALVDADGARLLPCRALFTR